MVKVEIGSWYLVGGKVGKVTALRPYKGDLALGSVEVNGFADYDGGYFLANAVPHSF